MKAPCNAQSCRGCSAAGAGALHTPAFAPPAQATNALAAASARNRSSSSGAPCRNRLFGRWGVYCSYSPGKVVHRQIWSQCNRACAVSWGPSARSSSSVSEPTAFTLTRERYPQNRNLGRSRPRAWALPQLGSHYYYFRLRRNIELVVLVLRVGDPRSDPPQRVVPDYPGSYPLPAYPPPLRDG